MPGLPRLHLMGVSSVWPPSVLPARVTVMVTRSLSLPVIRSIPSLSFLNARLCLRTKLVTIGAIPDGQLHCSVFTGEGVTYRLEPTHKHFKGKQQFSHVIFPFSAVRDVAKPPGTPANQSWCGCGASGFHEEHEEHEEHDHQEQHDSPLRRMASEIKERSRRAFPVKNTCEFGLYSDHRFYGDAAFGQSSVSTTTSAMIEQLSFAAAIYASTNFDLRTGVDFVGFSPVHALAAVTVFTTPTATGNPWGTISTSSADFLNQAKMNG